MRLAGWLAPRGLAFNEDKTRVVHLDEGFDFLGFNVRRYQGKLLIKPSKAAIRRIRERLAAEMRALRGANVVAVIRRLNPIIRGWSAYYRTVVSSEAFAKLDSTFGRSLTSGLVAATRTNRSAGLSNGTSGRSTSPGRTAGCSATAKAAPTCSSSAGPKSSGTRWCEGRRHLMTRPWPSTGPGGDNASHHHWTASACAFCRRNEVAVQFAVRCCCTPTVNPKASRNGNSGSR